MTEQISTLPSPLREERAQALGYGTLLATEATDLRYRGLFPGFYRQAAALAGSHGDPVWTARLAETLVLDAELPAIEALAWVAVFAGYPAGGIEAARSFAADSWRPLLDWRSAVPVEIAPLAWAAGLTPQEARDRQVAGTLTEAGLRTMAGLRGFRLSPAAEVDR